MSGAVRLLCTLVCVAVLGGCGGAGGATLGLLSPRGLTVTGQDGLRIDGELRPPARLTSRFPEAVYGYADSNTATFVLVSRDRDAADARPEQAAVLRMFWRPRAGRTPIERTATNATLQYLVFPPGGEAGVYTGAGFIMPDGEPGDDRLGVEVQDAYVQLRDAGPRFLDLLGRAELDGSFTARRDDARARALLRELETQAAEALGYRVAF